MHLYGITKILFFLLFELKDIFLSSAISLENDITKPLDKLIAKVFTIDAVTAYDLFATITDYKLKGFEHNLTRQIGPFQTRLFFQDVNFKTKAESESESDSAIVEKSRSVKLDESDEPKSPEIYWKFSQNKITIFFEELFLEAKGTICTRKNQPHAEFHTYIGILNATFTAVASKSPTNPNRLKISHNFSYVDFCTSFDENEDIHWTNLGEPKLIHGYDSKPVARDDYYDYAAETKLTYKNSTEDEPHHTIISSLEQKSQLEQEVSPILPLMICETIDRNEEFTYHVKEIFHTYYQPRKEIISKHPDFLTNPQQFYYLIPKSNYLRFTLKRILISGLSNLDTFKVHKAKGIFTHTLLVKNIDGCMTLDYGSENETPLKMNFHIDCLFISRRQDTNCVYVQAQYYHIVRAKANISLTGRQAEAMIHGLESAIASSILPSMEVGKVCDLESPLEEIKVTNMSDWKTVKESYKGWIPFSDDSNNTPFNV